MLYATYFSVYMYDNLFYIFFTWESFELQALEEPTKAADVTEGSILDTHSEVVLFYISNLYLKTKVKG